MSQRIDERPLPAPVPEACPGTNSQSAGNSKACEGCPNQQICASGTAATPDPDIEKVRSRLKDVKHIILVLSGKGGVGKSTFSSQLAFALSRSESGDGGDDCSLDGDDVDGDILPEVGLLDIDICGPSIPLITGVSGQQVHMSADGWTPIYAQENLAVMSIGFILKSSDEAVIWKGPKKNGMIKQFLRDVSWGELDYLIVDTPPGTSDEHLSVVQYLSGSNLAGAVVITTPQEVSLLDVRKEINFCKKVKVPVIGVVENMSGFVCPKCQNKTEIFFPSTGGAEKMASEMNVPFLGRIPLDPTLARACDEGQNFLEKFPQSPAYPSIISIIQTSYGKESKDIKDRVRSGDQQ